MNDEAQFLAVIAQNPSDWSRRQIYADWLEEQGRLACAVTQRACAEAVEAALRRERTHQVQADSVGFRCRRMAVEHLGEGERPLPQTTVWLDGREVQGLVRLLFEIDVEGLKRVELEFSGPLLAGDILDEPVPPPEGPLDRGGKAHQDGCKE